MCPAFGQRVRSKKIIFLFLNQNICCGYSKEPSRWDGSFEHQKHMLKLLGKKILQIYSQKFHKPHFDTYYNTDPSIQ